MVTDPVCLRPLDEQKSVETSEFRGQRYYFHTERCKQVFEQDPEEYVGVIPEKAYGDHERRPSS